MDWRIRRTQGSAIRTGVSERKYGEGRILKYVLREKDKETNLISEYISQILAMCKQRMKCAKTEAFWGSSSVCNF